MTPPLEKEPRSSIYDKNLNLLFGVLGSFASDGIEIEFYMVSTRYEKCSIPDGLWRAALKSML
jgi:hypothetical protein